MRYTLGKDEKLKSKKQIAMLFSEGKRIKHLPLVLIYTPTLKENQPTKVGFSVPKRNVKLAVHRNRIKRLIREAYRINKSLFLEKTNKNYAFMFLYISSKEVPFASIEKAVKKIANTLQKEI